MGICIFAVRMLILYITSLSTRWIVNGSGGLVIAYDISWKGTVALQQMEVFGDEIVRSLTTDILVFFSHENLGPRTSRAIRNRYRLRELTSFI